MRELFDERDRRFSRFLPSSEINRVNASPQGVTVVSEEFASMLSLSIDAARATDGLVTPAVGSAVLAAGYDRDFSLIPPDGEAVEPARVPGLDAISLRGRILVRAEPVTLDLNGVVKGQTVDDALALARRRLDLGRRRPGDVVADRRRTAGRRDGARLLRRPCDVEHRRARLAAGRRASAPPDRPRTGAPARTPWTDVTVAAPSCLVADIAAKAALLLGSAGPSWLDGHGLAGALRRHLRLRSREPKLARPGSRPGGSVTALTWYVARSAGIVAYLLLSTSVVLGVLMSARAQLRWPRFAVQEVHRFLAILTAVFIGLHGAALLADKVMPISIVQLLVPFQSSYRPFAVGLGVTSALLMAAVALSNLLRKKIPFRFWRRIHYLTLAVWLTATAHALLSGTDRRDVWFISLVGAAVCSVGLAFLGRFARTVTLGSIGGVAAATVAAVLALSLAPQPAAAHHTTALAAARPAAATVPAAFKGVINAQVQGGDSSPVLSVVGYAGTAGPAGRRARRRRAGAEHLARPELPKRRFVPGHRDAARR